MHRSSARVYPRDYESLYSLLINLCSLLINLYSLLINLVEMRFPKICCDVHHSHINHIFDNRYELILRHKARKGQCLRCTSVIKGLQFTWMFFMHCLVFRSVKCGKRTLVMIKFLWNSPSLIYVSLKSSPAVPETQISSHISSNINLLLMLALRGRWSNDIRW